MNAKPRVAFFDFTCCEGCQLTVSNLEERLLDLVEVVDIVTFREIMTEQSDHYDIAFVEGSITRESEIPRIKQIRERAKILVALGSCATLGGINCSGRDKDQALVEKMVYPDAPFKLDCIFPRPVSAVVPVDFNLHQCPIDKEEFIQMVAALAMGKKPFMPSFPVCIQCKRNGNVCVFEKGLFCLGPVTRAGCDSVCVNEGSVCVGCRGWMDDPNLDSHKEVLARYGLTVEDALKAYHLYGGWFMRERKIEGGPDIRTTLDGSWKAHSEVEVKQSNA